MRNRDCNIWNCLPLLNNFHWKVQIKFISIQKSQPLFHNVYIYSDSVVIIKNLFTSIWKHILVKKLTQIFRFCAVKSTRVLFKCVWASFFLFLFRCVLVLVIVSDSGGAETFRVVHIFQMAIFPSLFSALEWSNQLIQYMSKKALESLGQSTKKRRIDLLIPYSRFRDALGLTNKSVVCVCVCDVRYFYITPMAAVRSKISIQWLYVYERG